MRLLLVVDDRSTRNTFKKTFQKRGHSVCAITLLSTVRVRKNIAFDAALFDLNIERAPEDNVVSALKQIAHSVPTLALFAKSFPEESVKALNLGERKLLDKNGALSRIMDLLESFESQKRKQHN